MKIALKLSPRAKAIVAAVGAVVGFAAQSVNDGSVDVNSAIALVVGVTTAVGVHQVPNKQPTSTDTSDTGSVA